MRALGKDKRRMALWLFVAAVLGIVVAFSIPRTYKSVVMLAPETTGSSMASSISSLASMVGIYGSNNIIFQRPDFNLMTTACQSLSNTGSPGTATDYTNSFFCHTSSRKASD